MRELIEPIEVLNDGIKRSSPFREPVPSESIIAPFVVIAMEEYVIKILGRSFYDELVNAKNGVISIYNPSERLGEVQKNGFENEKYEKLWTVGGLRDLCGWCVALVSCMSLGTQVKQGGLTRYEGGGNDKGADIAEERRLLQNWERGVEVMSRKVSDYLGRNMNEPYFEKYRENTEGDKDGYDEGIIREVGLLKMDLPRW